MKRRTLNSECTYYGRPAETVDHLISAAAARLGDPAEVTITLLPTPNYRVDAHLEWLTARALAYRILRLTDEMAYQSRDT